MANRRIRGSWALEILPNEVFPCAPNCFHPADVPTPRKLRGIVRVVALKAESDLQLLG